MRDASDGPHYFQEGEHGEAGRTLQPHQSTEQGREQGKEEMVTPVLQSSEHPLEELKEVITDRILVDAIQIKRQDQDTSDTMLPSETDLLPLLLDPDFRRRADALREAQHLAQSQIAPIIVALQHTLDDPRLDVRISTLQALGALNRRGQFHLFVLALQDPAWRVRTTAVRELGKLGFDAPRTLLISALDDPDISVRDAALWALKPLAVWAWEELRDGQPLNAIAAALRDESELVRAAATEIVGGFERYVPIGELVKLLRDDASELVRAAATEALGKRREYQPVSAVLFALHNDKSEIVRAAAAEALGEMHEYMPITSLLQAFHHDRAELVRAAAIKSLGTLGENTPGEVLEALILALKDPAETVRSQAHASLSELHEQIYERASLPFLFSLLQNECDDVRRLAVWALGVRQEHAAREHLVDALFDTNDAIKQTAIWALEQLARHTSPSTRELELPRSAMATTLSLVDEQAKENILAQDLFLALVNFVKEKKGYIKAETRGEHVLVLKCYYQKEGISLQEAVLNHKRGAFHVQHMEKALKGNDEMIREIAWHALHKRERQRWTETFLVSLDITQKNSQQLNDDVPSRIIVCSIAYHKMADADVSISNSIDQYIKEHCQRPLHERACAWLERCKEPIFRYARGVSGIKVWYDSVASPAHT